ncbi:MAG TPA: ABC transporter ATP-binding protein [Xanthobacteraceae bacterium]|jgi:ABC-type branched-subunit amino acid transport system ATPase component
MIDGAPILLRASGLRKSFGGVRAVQDISLSVAAGTVFAVIGPNGAGKSTLLNLLSGVYRPDIGSVTFDGADLTRVRAHRRVRHGIARTFQKIRLFPRLSAIENVVAGFHTHVSIPAWQYVVHGAAFRANHARCRDEAARLLAFMGLAARANVPAGSLSYGERRMLEIARALATMPRLLMVDEPAAGLNAQEVENLVERLQTLRRDGLTILVVEHNMDLVMTIADRVLVIDYGQHLFEGAPAEVQQHPGVIAAYLGDESPNGKS